MDNWRSAEKAECWAIWLWYGTFYVEYGFLVALITVLLMHKWTQHPAQNIANDCILRMFKSGWNQLYLFIEHKILIDDELYVTQYIKFRNKLENQILSCVHLWKEYLISCLLIPDTTLQPIWWQSNGFVKGKCSMWFLRT